MHTAASLARPDSGLVDSVPRLPQDSAFGTLCGLLVLSPFVRWRHDHAVHQATSGDLDSRGVGDIPTLAVAEY